MSQSFGDQLKALIDSRFDSRREFIRAAEPHLNEEGVSGYLSKVIAGTRPPPLDRLDAWADALDLKAEAREIFIDLAALAHLPEQVRGRFEKMYAEHRDLMQFKRDILKLRK